LGAPEKESGCILRKRLQSLRAEVRARGRRRQPNFLELCREGFLFLLRNVSQYIPHEVDFAPLPGSAGKAFPDGGGQSLVGIGDNQRRGLQSALFLAPEHLGIAFFGLFRHRLYSQRLPAPLFADPANNQYGHTDNTAVHTDFFIQGICPYDGILTCQGTAAEFDVFNAEAVRKLLKPTGGYALYKGFQHNQNKRGLTCACVPSRRTEYSPVFAAWAPLRYIFECFDTIHFTGVPMAFPCLLALLEIANFIVLHPPFCLYAFRFAAYVLCIAL